MVVVVDVVIHLVAVAVAQVVIGVVWSDMVLVVWGAPPQGGGLDWICWISITILFFSFPGLKGCLMLSTKPAGPAG